jgi:WhiB family redox-sensing transcriptional regulator
MSHRRISIAPVNALIGDFVNAVNSQPWMRDAACRNVDPEVFFPFSGDSAMSAKAICAKCPVLTACFEYGLERTQDEGVLGGLAHWERRELRAKARDIKDAHLRQLQGGVA